MVQWYTQLSTLVVFIYIIKSKFASKKCSATTFMENQVESKEKIGFSIKFLSVKQRDGSKRNSKKHCDIQSKAMGGLQRTYIFGGWLKLTLTKRENDRIASAADGS
jgi:hypothetical protein